MDRVPIEPNRKLSIGDLLALGIPSCSDELHVVGLPAHRGKASVEVGWLDTVDRTASVPLIVKPERVEDLGLVSSLMIHAAIASALPERLRNEWSSKLKVEPIVTKALLRRATCKEQIVFEEFRPICPMLVDTRLGAIEKNDC